jgi:hypothetical protein
MAGGGMNGGVGLALNWKNTRNARDAEPDWCSPTRGRSE